MIVRVSYSKEQNLGSHFDETQNRSAQHLQYEDWGEFLVIWRRNRVELYENHVGLASKYTRWNARLRHMFLSHKNSQYPARNSLLATNISRSSFR